MVPFTACVEGEVALLDPPREVVYTTRAPVSAPLQDAEAEWDPAPQDGARRATNSTDPDTPNQIPGEAGQNH
jgi:hypothetical protein